MPYNFTPTNSCGLILGTSDDTMTNDGIVTFSLWAFIRGNGAASLGRLFCRENVNQTGPHLQTQGTQQLSFVVEGTTRLARTSAVSAYSLNTWNHIAVTWLGTNTAADAHIYVNGSEVTYTGTTNGVTIAENSGQHIRVGNASGSNRGCDAEISDVAVWNSVLSQHEIELLARSRTRYTPLQVSPSTLKRYWPLDDTTAGVSASDNNGVRDLGPFFSHGSGTNATGGSVPVAVSEEVLSYP